MYSLIKFKCFKFSVAVAVYRLVAQSFKICVFASDNYRNCEQKKSNSSSSAKTKDNCFRFAQMTTYFVGDSYFGGMTQNYRITFYLSPNRLLPTSHFPLLTSYFAPRTLYFVPRTSPYILSGTFIPNNEKAFLIVFPTDCANCTRNTFLS